MDDDGEVAHRRLAYEVTTHVAIHTLHLDGLRELYRHFLRLPDGAILEVFGDINMPTIVPDNLKEALANDTQLMQSVPKEAASDLEAEASPESQNQLRQRREEKKAVPDDPKGPFGEIKAKRGK